MDVKLMYIFNDNTPSVDYNQWLKHLDTHFNELTNQNSINAPKVVKPTIRKLYYKTLGTSVINSPISPISLILPITEKYKWNFIALF